jgi:hypothetical protein
MDLAVGGVGYLGMTVIAGVSTRGFGRRSG